MKGHRLLPFSPLPIKDWPPDDQDAWNAARAANDPLYEPTAAACWATTTAVSMVLAYGSWLAWLQDGHLLDPTLTPASRLTPDRVRSYLEVLNARLAPLSVASNIQRLYLVVKALQPDADLEWLKNPVARLLNRAEPVRNKIPMLVDSFRLFQAGLDLMAEAETSDIPNPRVRAIAYRDGLMVAFLAVRPVRIENLYSIRLGKHLQIDGNAAWVTYAAEEVKTRDALEFTWPDELMEHLTTYLTIHRPVLLDTGPSEAFWMSRVGPLSKSGARIAIETSTEKTVGVAISPHIFRDCAATTIAFLAPTEVHIIMSILGHTSLRTSQKHYNHATSIMAGNRHQDMIANMRRELRKKARPSRCWSPE